MIRAALRATIATLPDTRTIRILSGPSRGHRWLLRSGLNSFWTGTYERPQQTRIHENLWPGEVAYDIGANVGFHTLLMARHVGPTGHVHAFEHDPRCLDYLRRHVTLNGYDAIVTVHALTVGRDTDWSRYPPPHFIKMDIEGAEHDALASLAPILLTARPYLVIDGHPHHTR